MQITRFALIVSTLSALPLAHADLTFRSGNGADHTLDSQIGFLAIDHAATASAIELASAGAASDHATVIPFYSGSWDDRLEEDPTAEWISTQDDPFSSDAIFSFRVGPSTAGPQKLHLSYMTDNYLGTPHFDADGAEDGLGYQGVYINGTAVAGSQDLVGGFSQDLLFDSGDISGLLSTSQSNLIQIVLGNESGTPSGLIFSGSIAPVPEPATFASLALGALAVLRRRKRA